jgi:pimeloyl-ACP methyl ester carboxylesterase
MRTIRFIGQLALMAALFLGSLTLFQHHMLYFPQNTPLADVLLQAQSRGLERWPTEGDYRGLVREPTGPARATLVIFHGNAGQAWHRAHYADLSQLGLRVILAEYPGYGPRSGTLREAALVADAAETITRARQQFGDPVLVLGESLGAGVAAAAFAQVPGSVAGLLLITPWDRLVNVAQHHYPWLPVRWLLRDRYDSQRHLAQATVPIAVVVAERDTIVPARFGERLYLELPTPRHIWRLPQAGHNDWLAHVDAAWWQEVFDFLLPLLP